MKFTLKTLVAAVALAACAGQASAAIQPGTTASGATGSELVFYAFDDVTKTSYVKDLGVTFSAFLASPTFASVSIASDGNWGSYLTSVANDTSNTKWGIFATEKTSALAANGVNILTTARNNAPATTSSGIVKGIDGSFNATYLGGLQGAASNYAVNDSYFATGATNAGNWAAGMQHTLNGKVSFLADNVIGATADFYRLSAAASASVAATQTTVLSGPTQWKFDGANIQVTAAVPEPESYAMMLAGLLMLGGIARRRIGKN